VTNADELRELKSAWLSPSGEIVVDADDFYPEGNQGWHEQLAACLLRDQMGLTHTEEAVEFVHKSDPHGYVYEYLEARGWIRYCHWCLKWVIATRMQTAQRRVIEQWCEVNDQDWSKCVDIVLEP
jgi:hypothetical protein